MFCEICGEESNYWQHDESAHDLGIEDTLIKFDCNYDVDHVGDPPRPIATCDHHEFEAGCYCGESGRCVVCVDQAVDYADHMRDAAKEG
jgi:hypothetical protein|tara:strand:- start:309 stop:575 length:267 start_codon:yes stop_codon:yes gene_type:complete